MTFSYANTAETARRLLERFGAVATLRRATSGGYDPATGESAPTAVDHAVIAVVIAYDQKYIDGTLIQQGDQRAFLDASQAPAQGDTFAWQGKDWHVVAVKPIAPAGTPVLFEAQLRG